MKITREAITEAIKLSKDVLPKFTAFEMARVIGVPVKYLLRAIQANLKNFKFDAEKNIISLDSTSQLQNINSNEVWGWYLKNRLGGNDKACLTVSDQQRLMASLNSRIKWDISFGLVTATFASPELSGTDVRNRIAKDYSSALTDRLIKLGTVSGSGQIPDRYLFGIVLTEAEIKARKIESLFLYSPDWAMEEMIDEIDWVDVEVPDPYEMLNVPFGGTLPPQDPGMSATPPAQPPGGNTDTQKILAGAGTSKPPIPGAVQRARRTREQIDADFKKMIDELNDRMMFTPEQIDTVAKAKNITDAEKAYKILIEESDAVIAKEDAAKKQQQISLDGAGTDMIKQAPVEVFKPVEKTQSHQHVPPPINSAPIRPSMPTLADLEKVSDIKASIRNDAGMPAPPSVSTAPVTPPVAAAAMFPPEAFKAAQSLSAPPVANPPPAGASSSAEDLLNGLLRSTGQLPG